MSIRLLIYLFTASLIFQISSSANAMSFKFKIYPLSVDEPLSPADLSNLKPDVQSGIKKISVTDDGGLEVESPSYEKSAQGLMESISQSRIPKANKLTWIKSENKEITLYEIADPDLFRTMQFTDETADKAKVLPIDEDRIGLTIRLTAEAAESTKTFRKIKTNLATWNYRVSSAGPAQEEISYHYMRIFIANNIAAVTEAIQRISSIPEVIGITYNGNGQYGPDADRYRIALQKDVNLTSFIRNLVFNDIEVNKVSMDIPTVSIHFPRPDQRNEAKLIQIANTDGVVFVESKKNPLKKYFNQDKYVPIIRLQVPDVDETSERFEKGKYHLAYLTANKLTEMGFIVTRYDVDQVGEFDQSKAPDSAYAAIVEFTYPLDKEHEFSHKVQMLADNGGKMSSLTDEGFKPLEAHETLVCEKLFIP